MISANFAVAVVTVVLRGLLDRILAAVQAPVIKSPLIPPSTSIVLVSGTLYLLYHRLIKGRRIHVSYTNSSNKRPKILDGRIHKNGSQSSSMCNFKEHRTWLPRKFRSHRSRSRCRSNLLAATKDSLQLLHNQCSSTCSLSSKSNSSIKCRCAKDNSVARSITKDEPPSVYSFKSEGENLQEKIEDNTEANSERCRGFGDCDWEERPKNLRRRKRMRTTRKTRSGKIYSSYI